MKWLSSLQMTWQVGFALIVVLGATLLAWGLFASIILLPISFVLDWSEREFEAWLKVSAIVWAPLGIGTVAAELGKVGDTVRGAAAKLRGSP